MNEDLKKYMDENDELRLVPEGEIKAAMAALSSDHEELKAQMAKDKEETGLAIDKRADDLETAKTAVEDFSKRMDDITEKVNHNAYAMTFGDTGGELKDALQSFQGGFSEFQGDNPAAYVEPGTKPNLKHIIEGVFVGGADEAKTFHAPNHVAILRLQKAADAVYIVDACMRAQMDDGQRREYDSKGGARSLKTYKQFEAIAGQFGKAAAELIDRVTEVVNWIPTQYSSQLWEQIKIGLPLVNLFPEVQMAAPTVILPLDMNDNEATRVTEVTTATSANPYADTVFVNPGAFASQKITLVAEKLRSRYWVSQEATEDAVVAMIGLLERKHNRNLREAIEDFIVNGQVSGLDTGGTHFSKTNPSASTDARDICDGLRYFAAQYTGSPATRVDNSNGKATVVALRDLRASMGEYGVMPADVAYIFGIYGYVKLLDDTQVSTIDKFGPQATVRTGSLAQVDGTDVMVSRRVPQNTNAAGIIDGGGVANRTLALAVHTEGCVMGNRRRITLGQTVHGSSDTTELFAFWRGDFQAVYAVADVPFVAELYNIAAA